MANIVSHFLWSELRGRAFYLGTGAKRPVQVEGETSPSEVDAMRHFVLGIIRRKTVTVVLNAYRFGVGKCLHKMKNRIGKEGEKWE